MLVPNEKEREGNKELELNPYALQPPPRKQKNASTTTPAIAKNGRLYLAEEIRMLNRREENGNFRQFQHFSRASLIYSPDRPTGTIPKTSTVLGPQARSRITDRDRLQNIPNLRGLQPGGEAFADIFTDEESEPQRREKRYVPESIPRCRPTLENHFRSGDESESANVYSKRFPRNSKRKRERPDQRMSSSEDEDDYFSTEPPYIDSGKEQSRRRKTSHEVALENELRRTKELLKSERLRNSQERNSGSEGRNSKNNKEKRKRRVNIRVSSSEESSTEEDSPRPSYVRSRHSRRDTEPQSLEIVRRNINDYRLSFNGETKQAEEFLEALSDCYETCNVPFDLWLQSIRRVFKGKAREWFKNNVHYMMHYMSRRCYFGTIRGR